MKTSRILTMLVLGFVCLAVSAGAQTRRKTTTKKPAPKPTASSTTNAIDLQAGKDKVSNQISNVTKFVDLLGKVSVGIETVDMEAKTKKLPQKTLDENAANKTKVIQAIKNLRAGLTALETDFRTKPALRKYLLNIEGIAALSLQSEQTAIAGKFSDAGKPLLLAVDKLSNTLSAMP